MAGYTLFKYKVRYIVHSYIDADGSTVLNTPNQKNKVAFYNISAPSRGVADEEIQRAFHTCGEMTFECTDRITVHCAIQLVRWGLGVEA